MCILTLKNKGGNKWNTPNGSRPSIKGPDDLECAFAGTDRLEAFLKSISCPAHFFTLGIDDQLI
jgi:hypothetical protein